MQKHPQQKHKSPDERSGSFIAIVPVKISIGHGETILKEYDDKIDVKFTETSPDGKKNIGRFLYLTKEKGLSTEEALFMIASKSAEEFSRQFAAKLHVSPPVELKVHIKRNGEITYGKLVS